MCFEALCSCSGLGFAEISPRFVPSFRDDICGSGPSSGRIWHGKRHFHEVKCLFLLIVESISAGCLSARIRQGIHLCWDKRNCFDKSRNLRHCTIILLSWPLISKCQLNLESLIMHQALVSRTIHNSGHEPPIRKS